MDILEGSKTKTRKSQGLLLSYTQVNSSSWQINDTFIHFENVSEELFIKWIKFIYFAAFSEYMNFKGRDEIKTLWEGHTIWKKISYICFECFFFKFLWPFQKSWTFHIFLWFPWCLKKPWCNLRYRFLWITSKCRSFWGISNHVFFAVRNQLELMEFFENTTKLLKSVHN